MPPNPAFRLVRRAEPIPAPPVLDPAQRQVVDHPGGLLRVLAGPGTGKTTALVEAVVDRIQHRGVPVDHILMLTFSRASAGELRDRVTARLQRTVSEPVARTFHSYAFGIVRQAAVLAGDPPPRLLSGSEQDVIVREIMLGRLEEQRDAWPAHLAAAVRTSAFADELRELLMRAIERDIQPHELAAMGEQHGRPDWVVSADVLAEYYQVTALQAPGAFDAAELIQRARSLLIHDADLLASERAKRRRIFVDEYQDTDPAQIELLQLIADGADELVVVGDPDQAIYSFRGAEQNAMAEVEASFGPLLVPPGQTALFTDVGANEQPSESHTVALTVSRRCGSVLLDASRRVAGRLGGGMVAQRALTPADGQVPGDVKVMVFNSATEEAAQLATVLRRAHVEDGVAWSKMAVLVRSTGQAVDSLRRGLAAAGVPIAQPVRGALIEEPAVQQLLMFLRCIASPAELTVTDATGLVSGSVGRADPLQVLRMRRYLQRASIALREPGAEVTLADLVTDPTILAFIPLALEPPIRRVHKVIAAGTRAIGDGGSAEDVLWEVWQATGLAGRLEEQSIGLGAAGARADRDLDAVLALFAEAAKVTDRAPGSGAAYLYEWVTKLQITDAGIAPSQASSEVVPILTAHASKGREWDVVCVAGVQEGTWPNLRQRGSLLGADLLVDLHAQRPAVSSGLLAQRLAEERRLFYVAATRARRRLVVSAIVEEDRTASRFLDEIDPLPEALDRRVVQRTRRPFALPGIVAELRGALTSPDTDIEDRTEAAAQLRRLAAEGIPGADPAEWWGLADISSSRPIRDPARGPVPIRPSKFEAYSDCELRALLMELGAVDAQDETAASLGTLIHSIAERASGDSTVEQLLAVLDREWSQLDFPAAWHGVAERARAERMIVELVRWRDESRTSLTEVGRELSFRVTVGDASLSGKVDRLEQDRDGRLVVVDLKTGKSKPSKKAVAEHAQLSAYQLAVTEGAFRAEAGGDSNESPVESGGALLVQLGASAPGPQRQPPLAEFEDPDWVRTELARIAAVLRGPTVTATPGRSCARCLIRSSCPAQPEGHQVVS